MLIHHLKNITKIGSFYSPENNCILLLIREGIKKRQISWSLRQIWLQPHLLSSVLLFSADGPGGGEGGGRRGGGAKSGKESVVVIFFIYRRPTLYPVEIAVDFLKSL